MSFIRHFLIAIQFFTRIPIDGRLADWVGFSPAMLRASAAHFPGVGWVVGGLTALVFWGLVKVLPVQPAASWVAAVLSTAFSVWLTGAFHEDGLADTADGLGGAVSRERALDIMKDSRIGSYGAIALVLALIAKVLLLGLLVQVAGANQRYRAVQEQAAGRDHLDRWAVGWLGLVGCRDGTCRLDGAGYVLAARGDGGLGWPGLDVASVAAAPARLLRRRPRRYPTAQRTAVLPRPGTGRLRRS